MFSKKSTSSSTEDDWAKIRKLKERVGTADAVIIGAGAGLSAAAGLLYSGERFQRLFPAFIQRYQLTDMYSAAFYPHKTPEEHWGYWSMHIYHNRYRAEIDDTYRNLLDLVKDKNYFVITTNGDHLFRLNHFEKERLLYTQGDYGLFQCSVPCHKQTYDNHDQIMEMVAQQKDLKIPTELVPRCPKCGQPMTVNLRMDETFVEDEGWHKAMERYQDFLKAQAGKTVLFLELGVGYNTPTIIKYPFWQMTYRNPKAHYACLNLTEEQIPDEIASQSTMVEGDLSKSISDLLGVGKGLVE